MAQGDPISGVDVGLHHKKHSSTLAFNGTGGTAVLYHDCRDYGRLMALCGHALDRWSAVYAPGPETEAVAYSTTRSMMNNHVGCTSVTFLRVQIVGVSHVGGAVEVKLNYGAVQRLPLGGNVGPSAGGPLATYKGINNSRSNIRTN